VAKLETTPESAGVYMIYRLVPTTGMAKVKIGRSRNLRKRLLQYMNHGIDEQEMAWLTTPKNDQAVWETWLKYMMTQFGWDLWQGSEFYEKDVAMQIRSGLSYNDVGIEEAIYFYEQMKTEDKSRVFSRADAFCCNAYTFFEEMRDMRTVESFAMYEFASAMGLWLPGLLFSVPNQIPVFVREIERAGELSDDFIDSIRIRFKDCITQLPQMRKGYGDPIEETARFVKDHEIVASYKVASDARRRLARNNSIRLDKLLRELKQVWGDIDSRFEEELDLSGAFVAK
jgi:hypothetical protein